VVVVETRVAIIAIIVESWDSVVKVNEVLHEYADHIIGRMGLPHKQRGINIISVVLDASQDTTSALAGKLGRISGVNSQTLYSK
jgi:putative iron-only hydrogenase system regulator